MIIGCDKGGNVFIEYQQRKSISSLINYPFDIKSNKSVDVFWLLEIKNISHNHEVCVLGYLFCPCLSNKEIMCIEEITKSGILLHQIHNSLCQRNTQFQAVFITIYIIKNKVH